MPARARAANLAPLRARLAEALGGDAETELSADGTLTIRWNVTRGEGSRATSAETDLRALLGALRGSEIEYTSLVLLGLADQMNYAGQTRPRPAIRARFTRAVLDARSWDFEREHPYTMADEVVLDGARRYSRR